ncbi:MAG: hypothetical protein ACD_49C00049G0026 [uncultured bacterium (gcode 4)]|uniref:Uncharacterized protein n=1 Tax=uncultured bacterium (gcode 4) TaxID=1234023 RepID=K2BC58_9BACT|nr:MAG: hypothetical protein ACD_49C00049G0026 [uncultured bacterium (gcode 4)]
MKKYNISEPFMSNLSEEKIVKVSLANWKNLIINEKDILKLNNGILRLAKNITDISKKDYVQLITIER